MDLNSLLSLVMELRGQGLPMEEFQSRFNSARDSMYQMPPRTHGFDQQAPEWSYDRGFDRVLPPDPEGIRYSGRVEQLPDDWEQQRFQELLPQLEMSLLMKLLRSR